MDATFEWTIPSSGTQQTGTTSSGSVMPLTDAWSLYVGPVRPNRAIVAIAPPGLDPDAVWLDTETYPQQTLINGGAALDLSTTGAQPDDGSIALLSVA